MKRVITTRYFYVFLLHMQYIIWMLKKRIDACRRLLDNRGEYLVFMVRYLVANISEKE